MQHRRALALTGATLALSGAIGLAWLARDSGDDRPVSAPSASSSPFRVIIPGKPGESAVVTDSDKVTPPTNPPFNKADVTYAQMMIAHHAQAIQMAELAPDRAADPGVKNLASRISAAQGPEIGALRAWLADRGQPESDPAHDHATMAGMQSTQAMAELTAARGADFDRRFVTMMTAHHKGAQTMVGDLLQQGSDLKLSEMGNETAIEQVSEIRRMAELGVL
ncbi:DUF305 domain-containing protein [Actinoplanes utahensis]|uniref:DUF305 domain-containing protein n=1 Tax=Actinoplanes utahensis TaxID=1869 RepID=A0A0A6UWP8_ACTUT|nr:DUF305 domain-containing protein [Actinoplanes utahensis]KHD78829.1 hypothetical protein MB27_01530 [Actinoplanes utahensis]GIF28238.1 lipoprotein [Actinoplanes utahensis]